MTGTLINIATIVVGTSIGMLLKSRLPQRIVKAAFQAIGLFTLALGLILSLKMSSFLIVVFSLILGVVAGELLNIEKAMESFSNKLKQKINIGGEHFSKGMLTAFLLFCMGSMTILGAFDEGIKGDNTLLITKSVMDGFAAIALSSSMGIGVGFSVIPLLIYQGGLTLLAAYLGNFFSETLINELTATGGILIIGLGLNILEIKQIKVFNLLPALVFVVILVWLMPLVRALV